MKVAGTPAAARTVEQVRRCRRGALVFTIGTGCCESTAPFLFEDFWPGPDHEVVGVVGGVPVYAPAHVRRLYPGSEGVIIDVEDEVLVESLSIETEHGSRFVLRESAAPTSPRPRRAATEIPATVSALRPRGPQELSEPLRRLRTMQQSGERAPRPRP